MRRAGFAFAFALGDFALDFGRALDVAAFAVDFGAPPRAVVGLPRVFARACAGVDAGVPLRARPVLAAPGRSAAGRVVICVCA